MNQAFRSIYKSFFGVVLLATFTACAPDSSKDSITMTINTGIPVRANAPVNLSKTLLSLMSTTPGVDCYQDQIYLVVHDPNTDTMLSTKKIMLRTNITNSIGYLGATLPNQTADVNTLINHLENSSFFDEPLKVVIPKFPAVEIAIMGTFFKPADGNTDGTCDQMSGPNALNSSGLIGHTLVTTQAITSGSINLNIDVMHTNPIAPFYSLGANPGRYHDWVQVDGSFLTMGNRSLSLGTIHNCSVINGGLQCWGGNVSGQMGNGTFVPSLLPTTVSGLAPGTTVQAVAGGNGHTCAIVNGAVKCWGYGGMGQIGNGSNGNTATPVSVSGIAPATTTSIASGYNHSCAIVGGVVKCWGQNTAGQLGTNNTIGSNVPVIVQNPIIGPLMTGVQAITTGDNHSCAIVGGGAYCWGAGTNGQLGDNLAVNNSLPIQVIGLPNGSGVQDISAGATHSCAVVNGGAQCWGYNANGQLGNPSAGGISLVPFPVVGLGTGVQAIAVGGATSCAIVNGGVQCWGLGTSGQLGIGSNTSSTTPVAVVGLPPHVQKIAVNGMSTCALVEGAEYCWGANGNGQLGDNTVLDKLVPTLVTGLIPNSTNMARLKTIRFLSANGVPEQITLKVDVTLVGTPKYYVPHLFPMTLEFEYNGAFANGGCGAAGTCMANYLTVVGDNGSGFIHPQLIPIATIGSVPPEVSPAAPFLINTY